MRQASYTITIRTRGKGLTDISENVDALIRDSGMSDALATLFCRHTSASLLIQENASPAARRDLEAYFERIAPEGAEYKHDEEGADDMPAHLRAALTQTQLSIPVSDGQLMTGRWQGIFLFEHRRGAQERQVVLHLLGE